MESVLCSLNQWEVVTELFPALYMLTTMSPKIMGFNWKELGAFSKNLAYSEIDLHIEDQQWVSIRDNLDSHLAWHMLHNVYGNCLANTRNHSCSI